MGFHKVVQPAKKGALPGLPNMEDVAAIELVDFEPIFGVFVETVNKVLDMKLCRPDQRQQARCLLKRVVHGSNFILVPVRRLALDDDLLASLRAECLIEQLFHHAAEDVVVNASEHIHFQQVLDRAFVEFAFDCQCPLKLPGKFVKCFLSLHAVLPAVQEDQRVRGHLRFFVQAELIARFK